MDIITFEPIAHQYSDQNGHIFKSATQFLELFHSKFEDVEDFWLFYKAIQYSSDIDKTKIKKYDHDLCLSVDNLLIEKWGLPFMFDQVESASKLKLMMWKFKDNLDGFKLELYEGKVSILEEVVLLIKAFWKSENLKSTDKGTAFHNKLEDEQFIDGKFTYKDIIYFIDEDYLNCKDSHILSNLKPGKVYPELRMHNPEFRIAGTSDQVIMTTGNRFKIRDWKGLALDTPIATESGWKKMEDIVVGDVIFDGEGNLTKVSHVSEIHHNPCYKITFDTNDVLIADHEHKWIITSRDPYRKIFKDTVMLTEDIYKYYQNNSKKLMIKCVGINLPEIPLPIDPYILGLWLVDGNRTCGSITCMNQDTWKEIENRGFKLSVDHNRNCNKTESRTIFGIYSELKKLNLIGNKHLPDIYLRGSHKQRLDLLRGFMDYDGHFHRKRRRCIMDTTKKWQADAIMNIASSLGYKPIIIPCKTAGFGKTDIPTWQVCFSPKENPFLSRNQDYHNAIKGKNPVVSEIRYIKNIELIDTVPTKCIGVVSNTHTYLAGRNLIKTHNTNKEIKTSNKYEKFHYPIEHLEVCEYTKYSLQLSLYAWMLEQFGYELDPIDGIEFEHFVIDSNGEATSSTIYKCPYLKDEILAMLHHYKENLIN